MNFAAWRLRKVTVNNKVRPKLLKNFALTVTSRGLNFFVFWMKWPSKIICITYLYIILLSKGMLPRGLASYLCFCNVQFESEKNTFEKRWKKSEIRASRVCVWSATVLMQLIWHIYQLYYLNKWCLIYLVPYVGLKIYRVHFKPHRNAMRYGTAHHPHVIGTMLNCSTKNVPCRPV